MTSHQRRDLVAGVVAVLAVAAGVYFIARHRDHIDPAKPEPVAVQPATCNSPLVISVEATYPGANAQTVADTVAAPIEQRVNGIEDMKFMSSRSSGDGTYKLDITFKDGCVLDVAQVRVQKRVDEALKVLPNLVQNEGISVKKKSPEVLMFMTLSSPDGRYNELYLSNYASIQIKDELKRVPGVGDIVFFGKKPILCIEIDPERLRAYDLTTAEVMRSLNEQHIQMKMVGGFKFECLGSVSSFKELPNIVIGKKTEQHTVYLRDIGSVVDSEQFEKSYASLDGAPAVAIGVYPLPSATVTDVNSAVLDKVKELRTKLPQGLALNVTFDFTANLTSPDNPTTPEYLLIDVLLPDAASAERIIETLKQSVKVLRERLGVQHTLVLFDQSSGQSRIVVGFAPADEKRPSRKKLVQTIRTQLSQQIQDALFRLCDPTGIGRYPFAGYPIDLVIEDLGARGSEANKKFADDLADKLKKSNKFTDIWVDRRGNLMPQLSLDVDRVKAKALGVRLSDIFDTLQVYLGSFYVNDFNEFGRSWSIQIDQQPRGKAADILELQVRANDGKMVPLSNIVSIKDTAAPRTVERFNMYQSVGITANPADGVTLSEACAAVEEAYKSLQMEKAYRLEWRRGWP